MLGMAPKRVMGRQFRGPKKRSEHYGLQPYQQAEGAGQLRSGQQGLSAKRVMYLRRLLPSRHQRQLVGLPWVPLKAVLLFFR